MLRVVKQVSAALLIIAVSWQGSAQESDIQLSGPSGAVAEGYFRLTLQGLPDSERFTIEMAEDDQFSAIIAEYQPMGMFRELSLSGFDNGIYYFRAQSGDQTSNTVSVEVRHYPLWQALSLFVVGAILFFLLIMTIIKYHRLEKRRQANPGDAV
ncbi:hypothetical protein CWE09_04365 [Aliidiomarina minuta]|uniref:Two component regulator three Y domain-containing protein n=1 Tax=Aliidiomarina minuta TaxID=880057 RepID=A0A432W7B2_9GAMM|nr:hypothetical protein [Aliidiomarina minuta]RUO25967.1 hypothetical protein CWE09_04365 [Aliidiomarina minuta]